MQLGLEQNLSKEAVSSSVEVYAPASLSNLGPGFDTLGLCLNHPGDRITARKRPADGMPVLLSVAPDSKSSAFPLDPASNTAALAAQVVLDTLGVEEGVELSIYKGFTPGSGIGSSAASAVAGAWAVNALWGTPLSKEDLIEAVLAGESAASGARHGDNVLPALMGGLVLTSASRPEDYRCIPIPEGLWIPLILPDIQVLTKEARAILPDQVPLRQAVKNASALAFMVASFRKGDWEAVGYWMMQDGLIEPERAKLVSCYHAVKQAALDAGAPGCAITGSGPAMYALATDEGRAHDVLAAMEGACKAAGVGVKGCMSQVDTDGVRTL